MKEVRDKIKSLVLDIMKIDIDQIDSKKNFFEMSEWDSFGQLILISRMESDFGISLNTNDIIKMKNLDSLIKIIEEKVVEKSG